MVGRYDKKSYVLFLTEQSLIYKIQEINQHNVEPDVNLGSNTIKTLKV